MSEATTLELFRQVHLFDLLDGDPDFREGFTQEVSKQATSDLGNATAFLPHPTQAQTIGGGIGLAGGLAAGMKMPGPWWLKGLAGISTHESEAWIEIYPNTQDIAGLATVIGERLQDPAAPLRHGFLMAGHGLYTWGENIAAARRQIEVLEFLFEVVTQKRLLFGSF